MKKILNVIKKLSERISHAEEKLLMLKLSRAGSARVLDGLSKDFRDNWRVDNLAIKILMLEEKIYQLKKILVACRIELSDWLKKFLSGTEFLIFYMKYGLLYSFRKISRVLKISLGKVFYLHSTGLKEIREEG